MNRSVNGGRILASLCSFISELWSALLNLHDEPGTVLSTLRVLTCFMLQQSHEVGINTVLIYPHFLNLPGKEKFSYVAKVTQLVSGRNFLSGCCECSVCRLGTELSSVLFLTLCLPWLGLSELRLFDSGQVQTTNNHYTEHLRCGRHQTKWGGHNFMFVVCISCLDMCLFILYQYIELFSYWLPITLYRLRSMPYICHFLHIFLNFTNFVISQLAYNVLVAVHSF